MVEMVHFIQRYWIKLFLICTSIKNTKIDIGELQLNDDIVVSLCSTEKKNGEREKDA